MPRIRLPKKQETFKEQCEDFVRGQRNFERYAKEIEEPNIFLAANAVDEMYFEKRIARGDFDDLEME